MKRIICSAVLAAIAVPSVAAAPARPALVRTSAKPVDPLIRCFAAAEDRAASPWWYVPKENGGGTFSNLGASNVRNPYFVDVADQGGKREIRLRSSNVDSAAKQRILAAIDRCA